MWAGFVNGQIVQVFAGSVRDDNWQAHPNLPIQGALLVTVNYDGLKGQTYPTSASDGALHLIAACGNMLVLQAADKTNFTFDAARLTYVGNLASCSSQTP